MYSLRNKHHSWCIYISFCVLCTFYETACILERNGVEYILSRVENIKILLNWVYTQLCWWRWFANFLSWGRPQHLSMELRLSTVLSWWRWGQSFHNWPNLGSYGDWAVRVLKRATTALTFVYYGNNFQGLVTFTPVAKSLAVGLSLPVFTTSTCRMQSDKYELESLRPTVANQSELWFVQNCFEYIYCLV